MSKKQALIRSAMVSFAFILCCTVMAFAAEEAKKEPPKGPPPMLVTAEGLEDADFAPETEIVGTIYFARKAKLAAEVGGLVKQINVEEGETLDKGKVLVLLKTDLLDMAITATRAGHEQALVELEKAKKDLSRIETLYQEESVSESLYDDHLYRLRGLEKKSEALRATLDRQKLERDKMTIQAPFGGIVMDKSVEVGEWVGPGGVVAVVADDREVDVIVDLPQHMLGFLKRGKTIEVSAGNRTLKGRFVNFVPQGDVATRTFAVKIRVKNPGDLVEGMEARAKLPTGEKSSGLFASRDAVIEKYGKQVVFLVEGTTVKMVPVKVFSFQGMKVAIGGEGLTAGDQVVTKGNERLRDGQSVRFK